MKLYLFERGGGKAVTAFGSEGFTMAGIVREAEEVNIGCMYLEKGGIVGGHPATVPQLLLVMAGEAIVRSGGGESHTIGRERPPAGRQESGMRLVRKRD